MQSRLRIMVAWSREGLSACGGSDLSRDGTISLSITDAPIDAARSIMVRFTGLALERNLAPGPGVQNAPDGGRVLPKVYLFPSAGLRPAAIHASRVCVRLPGAVVQPTRNGPIDFILPAP